MTVSPVATDLVLNLFVRFQAFALLAVHLFHQAWILIRVINHSPLFFNNQSNTWVFMLGFYVLCVPCTCWVFISRLMICRNAHLAKRKCAQVKKKWNSEFYCEKIDCSGSFKYIFRFCAVKGMPVHFILEGNICRRWNSGARKCLQQYLFAIVAVINTSHFGRDVSSTHIGQHKLTIK